MKQIESITMLGYESIMRSNIRSKIRKAYRYDVTVYFANESQLFIEFLGVTGDTVYKTQFEDIYNKMCHCWSSKDIATEAVNRFRVYLVNQFFYPSPIDKRLKK